MGKNERDAESAAAVPLLSDLVEVSGLGQVWVSNQWPTRLRDLSLSQLFLAKDRRQQETARLVCRDLPAFYKHVISVGVREANTMSVLQGADARAALAALARGKFEELDWTTERWRKELRGRRGGLELELAPGLGFSLHLVVGGDREVFVARVGRLTFAESPLPALRKVIGE